MRTAFTQVLRPVATTVGAEFPQVNYRCETIETTTESIYDCDLNPIAWYCYNSNDVTKPVGGKWPNAWGLYDMLGNASELLHEPDHGRSPAFPATDPFGEAGAAQDGRPETGGNAIGWPSLLRVASGLQASPNFGGGLTGFRLARTLSK